MTDQRVEALIAKRPKIGVPLNSWRFALDEHLDQCHELLRTLAAEVEALTDACKTYALRQDELIRDLRVARDDLAALMEAVGAVLDSNERSWPDSVAFWREFDKLRDLYLAKKDGA